MKNINKLLFPVMLLTPFLITSCGDDTKVSGLTIDAQEMVYAYSQTCSTSLTITSSDVEFVDDFKGEYFTFDNPDDIKGKTYVINKTSSKTIVITFTGAYTGTDLTKDNGKEITYKINKSAFKNNKVANDATGKMHMTWDNVKDNFGEIGGLDSITLKCCFTFTSLAVDPTKVTLNTTISGDPHDLSYYSTPATSGSITFSRVVDESNKVYLNMALTELPATGQHAIQIKVPNKSGAELFENLPENYGLTFYIKKDDDSKEYYLDVSSHDNLYFEKVVE